MVVNGVELGGGSIRIHNSSLQNKMFELLGFTEKAQSQFGFLMNAFQYGAPPHGGLAFVSTVLFPCWPDLILLEIVLLFLKIMQEEMS